MASGASSAPSHVAIVGAGFVGTAAAFAMVLNETAARITLTDVNEAKCLGEVLDLEDAALDNRVSVASPQEAGQADVIVITAGRGQKPGETRLDLVKANAAIMRSVVAGMLPIKSSAKLLIVANPCDALTFVAQECSGLPQSQVFGSGTVLDSKRLQVALAHRLGLNPGPSTRSVSLHVLGEHGDSQFPAASLGNIGGVPLLKYRGMRSVKLVEEARSSARKAYSIIEAKGYTAFGVGRAVEEIVHCILKDQRRTLPVSVRVPGKGCCLSLPCIVGYGGVERVLGNVVEHFSVWERKMYGRSLRAMQAAVGSEVDEEDPALADSQAPSPQVSDDEALEAQAAASSLLHDRAVHVAVVGAGFVGTNTAFALLVGNVASRVTLTDVNEAKCRGEVLDLEDGDGRVEMATAAEAGQADVIVVTAGRGQREGETRLDLVKANAAIMRSVVESMKPLNPRAKIIVVSNPCDALTYVAQECSGLPRSQVFGSGTVLDTRRLRIEVSRHTGVNLQAVHAFVLGEHGDSQFVAASLANIGGVPLSEWDADLESLSKTASRKAYDIISKKGYTAFGVARAVQSIVECVLHDAHQILPLSVRVPGKSCCLSLPCVVGVDGVLDVLDVAEHFSPEEKNNFDSSVAAMEAAVQAAG